MKKYFKISSFVLIINLILILNMPCSFADSNTWGQVQKIISGEQDMLVLATINGKGTSAYEVEIIHEINKQEATGTENDAGKENQAESDDNHRVIFVESLDSYMYYDNYDHQPKKGDNVLLSLTFNGNVYSVKNGAFRIDYADIDNFNFLLPENVGADVIAELSALYVFVDSDGKRGDVFVKDNKVFGVNMEGKQEEIVGAFGIKFVDEFGDTTVGDDEFGSNTARRQVSEKSWIVATAIIIIGMVTGAIVIYSLSKIEKKRG